MVEVTRLRTSGAWGSVKVRFSMVHIKGDTGGVKGITKKVTCGVDQQWPVMRDWMAGCGIAVTMKHQGAAKRRDDLAAASGAPTCGSGLWVMFAMAVLSF
jgi:hypothetical protein